MSQVHASIEINAPIERVWETIMDPERLADWVTIHRSVGSVSERPLATGATMQQTLRMHGVSFHVNWILRDVTAPHHAHWDGRGPAGSKAQIGYQLSAGQGEATVFDYTNDFTVPGGRLGHVASRVFVGDASQREANRSLARLKELLEKE